MKHKMVTPPDGVAYCERCGVVKEYAKYSKCKDVK